MGWQYKPKHIPIPPVNQSNKKQIPLKMAWPLPIHKSQGLKLIRSIIDIVPWIFSIYSKNHGFALFTIFCDSNEHGIISKKDDYVHSQKEKH